MIKATRICSNDACSGLCEREGQNRQPEIWQEDVMPQLENRLSGFGARIVGILDKACLVILTVLVGLIWFQVFYRYIFHRGVAWIEEIAKYLNVWMVLLGASVLLHENGHPEIDFLKKRFKNKRSIDIVISATSIALFVLLAVSGFLHAIFAYKSISPASGIRKTWAYLAIPIGAIFLIFESVIQLVQRIIGNSSVGDSPSAHAEGGSEQ